ncbi:MAG: arginyltransferase [Acidobacteriota bacterium]
MTRVHWDQIGDEETCSYLPDERARYHYRVIADCDPQTYTHLLTCGWRRFGRLFFRPVCAACIACRSLRIDVAAFTPSRSQRRARARNDDLRVRLGRPRVDARRLELYHRYHRAQAADRGWRDTAIDPRTYAHTFIEGAESFGHELTYWLGDQLLAVALVDILPSAMSAVYCYYDPSQRSRSLGVNSVLYQIELARAREIDHLHLGYWVEGNASMRYKSRYQPHELLEGRPALDGTACWRRVEGG